MEWLRRELRKGMNARTYLLVACLALTLLWIQSLDGRGRAKRARGIPHAAPTAAAAMIPLAATPEVSGPAGAEGAATLVGWGHDPFGPRFTEAGKATR